MSRVYYQVDLANGQKISVENEYRESDRSLSANEVQDMPKKNKDEMNDAHSNQNSESSKSSSRSRLFRYANVCDWALVGFGTLAALIHGAGFPVLFIFYGQFTMKFSLYGRYQICHLNYTICRMMNITKTNESEWKTTVQPIIDSFEESSIKLTHYGVYLAVAMFVFGTMQVACWSLLSLRQTKRLNIAYFRAILRQDMAFHDVTSAGELNIRLTDEMVKIKDGLGEKLSIVIMNFSTLTASLIIAFVYAWKLALVGLTIVPFRSCACLITYKMTAFYTRLETAAYAKAGSIAEEAISSIRTVVAFGCQHKEVDRYSNHLHTAKIAGLKNGFMSGFSFGFHYLSTFSLYGICFWYGTTLVLAGDISIAGMITTFYVLLAVSFSIARTTNGLDAFNAAKSAASRIFEVIDRVPEIDIFSEEGIEPNAKSGEISFDDVHFTYPSRPDVEVLEGVNMKVKNGQLVALVGQTGCGKSTVIQLIQRFYDVDSGSILIGGNDVKDLKLRRHREMIGVVAQEPVLFATTIAENIRWGREGVTDREMKEAAKQANAYDFIMKLPEKFDTLVGEGGGHMSGGQKQRIAIARAIARNPKILLLDEATSALDTESESIVQAALEKASEGRTTIVVAHRLSTIRNADKIVAFHEGRIMEEGTHEELFNVKGGIYANLIRMQAGREDDGGLIGSDIVKNNDTLYDDARTLVTKQAVEKRLDEDRLRDHLLSKQDAEVEENKEDLPESSFFRILSLNKPEWPYLTGGSIFALLTGAIDPVTSIIFAKLIIIFSLSNVSEQYSEASLCGILYFVLGVAGFLSWIGEASLFAKSGMELTIRLRKKAFKSMLRQEISYFDDHKNSTGALCTRLATDASRVQGCTGVRLGVILKNFSTLAIAVVIAFIYGWKLALLTIALLPFVAMGGVLEYRAYRRAQGMEQAAYEEAGQVANEAMSNIRTVASLTKEQTITELYEQKISEPLRSTLIKGLSMGMAYGYSQSAIYLAYAAAFRLGIELVVTGDTTYENVFKVLIAVIFSAEAIGWNSSFAPDYAEAKVSASRMFALFDKVPSIDAYSDEGVKPDHCKGELRLKSVHFTYPTRPDVPVLRGCDITVQPGQTLALVGQSGCGKSTTVQLLERFYDPQEGEVTLDGVDIRELNITWLRYQMGLVSQEPVLFDQSFIENIRYGDCTREASEAEVQEAAKNANIHDFISSLPKGYSTNVGAKGGQLSGGQKQRVAISRALLRNPKILLLDEATSALDSESERIVQDALDAAREGRTSIIIAHRLSTVRNADQIAVIDNGLVAEVGTHEELIARRGAYFSLVNAQLYEKENSLDN